MKKLFIIHILLAMPLLAWCDNITFADVEVKAICVKNWDTNGDGELSYDEAAEVYYLSGFANNKSIKSFDELQYFTGLKSINANVFHDCSSLTSVTIPNSVTSIGYNVFVRCTSLSSIIIPNSVTSIRNDAFSACPNLKTVYIDDLTAWLNITFNTISSNPCYNGAALYLNGELLTDLSIPNSVTSIRNNAFAGCNSLTSVTIPNSVTSIGDGAFYGCSSLTSITIPNSVTSIGNHSFLYCSSLPSVTIPNSVTSIGDGAFRSCSSLTSLTIPNSVTSIGDDAFAYCSSLTSLTIPNSVTSIGNSFFYNCSSLTSITIPNSVTSIGEAAFYGCSGLKHVKVESATPFNIDTSIFPSNVIIFVPKGCKEAYQSADMWKNYVISDQNPDEAIGFADAKVKEICVKNWDTNDDGELSYDEAAAVTSLDKAFWNNTVITSFDEFHFFIGLNEINKEEFKGCSNLSSISIPNSVQFIFYGAFADCSSLTNITIPNSVKSINDLAFFGCSSRKNIKVESGNLYYDSRQDCNAIIQTSTNTLILGSETTVIPKSVNSIGYGAFSHCSNLTDITIPNSVNSIGSSAFSNCSNLTDITIPNSVNSIGSSAFAGCSSLKSITLPNSLKSIADNTFSNCSSLKSITLPNSVKYIGLSAFYKCNLSSITMPNSLQSFDPLAFLYCNFDSIFISDLTSWCKITSGSLGKHHLYLNGEEIVDLVIPDGTITIGSIFNSCVSLKSIIIPSSVNSIGKFAFAGCSSLTSVTIPNSVTSIGESAFSGCSGLTSITIPNSVTSIGETAFAGCSGLTSIAIPSSVTEIGNSFIYGTSLTSIIWDADFTMPTNAGNGNTQNMLFYTKDASYAPSNIRNVIVNGAAKEIVLSDASSSNFYCPREFTAEKISYTHNYRMTSGLDGQARGWETIALPFTVSEITHESKGKLLPFGAWTSTSDAKPFWLCKLSSSGFTHATSIEANTPYIICMPNNSDYDSSFNLSGNVTFSATNVKVPVSSSVTTSKSNSKTFIPAFCAQDKSSTVYALNVSNSYHSELGGYAEGSAFVSGLRKVSPFEAYMTTSDSNAKRAFLIDFSETTGIDEIPTTDMKDGIHKIYNLNGQLVKQTNSQQELDETLRQLPAGVYVVNGKKTIIK